MQAVRNNSNNIALTRSLVTKRSAIMAEENVGRCPPVVNTLEDIYGDSTEKIKPR